MLYENQADKRSSWKIFTHVLHRHQSALLPDYLSISDLASFLLHLFHQQHFRYPLFFTDITAPENRPPVDRAQLHNLTPASVEEIRPIIVASPSNSCDLDPIPAALLKNCLDVLDVLPTPITSLVNMALSELHTSNLLSRGPPCRTNTGKPTALFWT